jgi:hypothetical protein
MAKVVGGLFSLDARGKFGNALVFSNWKGTQTVRRLVTPSNPQTVAQMAVRAYLAAGGKINKVLAPTSDVAVALTALTPSGQSYASYFIKEILGNNNANIAASRAAYELIGNATVAGYFDDEAAAMGLESVDLGTPTTSKVAAGLALWAVWDTLHRLGVTGFEDVTTAATEAHVQAVSGLFAA